MNNNGKFNLGLYMFALTGGLLSGLCFSKAQYHKGQSDAYEDITKELEKITNETNEWLKEHEVEAE